MKKKFRYSFTRKKEAEGGFSALVFASVSVIVFLAAVICSFYFGGNAGNWLGAFGITGVLLNICGFFIGIESFQEKGKSYWYSVIGSMANGIFFVGWLALFLIGV